MRDRSCATCGTPFRGHGNRRHCSDECKRAARRARPSRHAETLQRGAQLAQTIAACPECGDDFALAVKRRDGGYSHRKYCSEKCRLRAAARRQYRSESGQLRYKESVASGYFAESNRRYRARRRVTEITPCRYCQTPIERTVGSTKSVCDSVECRRAYGIDRCHLRNARQRDATTEVFTRAEIFERDGWMCGICNTAVDPDAVPRSPESVSLDHIIPLARGGAHSRENTQCAHLGCNQQKSATVLESAVTGDRI